MDYSDRRRSRHATSLTRVCGSNRVPSGVDSLCRCSGTFVSLCVLIDAERAMRGQAFGASGPSCWTDVRCLRAITSTTIRPVPQPKGTVQTSSPRAVRTWTWSGPVRARSHAHDEWHARSPAWLARTPNCRRRAAGTARAKSGPAIPGVAGKGVESSTEAFAPNAGGARAENGHRRAGAAS